VVLAGSGDDRDGLALSESARTVVDSPSDMVDKTGGSQRPAPLAAFRLPVSKLTDASFASLTRPPHYSRPTIPGMRALAAPRAPGPG